MRTTISVRTDSALRDALAERARAQGKTLSQLVREVLEAAVAEGPLARRTGHLRGNLTLGERPAEPWRATLRERNWRS